MRLSTHPSWCTRVPVSVTGQAGWASLHLLEHPCGDPRRIPALPLLRNFPQARIEAPPRLREILQGMQGVDEDGQFLQIPGGRGHLPQAGKPLLVGSAPEEIGQGAVPGEGRKHGLRNVCRVQHRLHLLLEAFPVLLDHPGVIRLL